MPCFLAVCCAIDTTAFIDRRTRSLPRVGSRKACLFFRSRPSTPRGGQRLLIDTLYYDDACPCCGGVENKAEKGIEFSTAVYEHFLREIYDGFDTSNDLKL